MEHLSTAWGWTEASAVPIEQKKDRVVVLSVMVQEVLQYIKGQVKAPSAMILLLMKACLKKSY